MTWLLLLSLKQSCAESADHCVSIGSEPFTLVARSPEHLPDWGKPGRNAAMTAKPHRAHVAASVVLMDSPTQIVDATVIAMAVASDTTTTEAGTKMAAAETGGSRAVHRAMAGAPEAPEGTNSVIYAKARFEGRPPQLANERRVELPKRAKAPIPGRSHRRVRRAMETGTKFLALAVNLGIRCVRDAAFVPLTAGGWRR
jgi:hypothetical protein